VSNGEIISVATYAFDRPSEGITDRTPTSVRWHSTTCGDTDGLVLELRPADHGRLTIETDFGRLALDLDDLGSEPVCQEYGGLGLRLEVERLPVAVAMDLLTTLCDERPVTGEQPYYVVVQQSDGAKAWSSPIWVTWEGPHM
jgi:hypothetical protein